MEQRVSSALDTAVSLHRAGRLLEAARIYDSLIAADPADAAAVLRPGVARLQQGNVADAEGLLRRAAGLDPKSAAGRANLGAALQALGRTEEALVAHEAAAGLARDEAAALAANRRMQIRLAGPVIRAASGRGHPTEVPIFVLGMPRSGSTLVEQILAGHPLVLPGGERKDFGRAMRRTWNRPRGDISHDMANSEDLHKLAQLYPDALPPLPEGKIRVTDKMPGNFQIAGLIHAAMPNARIIHTVRDPVDTCLSCFSKLFGDHLDWTYDLRELGRYYRLYRDMMEHWEDVLPPGTILDVRYEDVVDDLEGQARRLLEFCGLPWDDTVLAFHKTQRAVRTASVAQVREPIYRRSVGKWRPDDAVLRPFFEGLNSEV